MGFIDLFRYKRKGTFEKVPFEQFKQDFYKYKCYDNTDKCYPKYQTLDDMIRDIWNNIQLPYRKTQESMGHDFTVPFNFDLKPGETITLPTGVRCKLKRGWGLLLSVRSGCGKYRIQLDDTIPAIDGDYYMCERNGGDIIISLTNDNHDGVEVKFRENTSFIQGFIMPYGVDTNDWKIKKQIRKGGFGSTGDQNNTKK